MDELKIGVYVCNCGTNIAKVVDCDAVVEARRLAAGRRRGAALQVHVLQPRPGDDRRRTSRSTASTGSWSPPAARACTNRRSARRCRRRESTRTSSRWPTSASSAAGCTTTRSTATEKAKALTRAAVLRVAQHEPLERRSVDMCPNTLVIGGGIAGMTAALDLADAGGTVYLVDRADHLGGNVARVDLTAPYLDSARDMLTERITRVVEHGNIEVLLKSEVEAVDGFVGNFNDASSAAGRRQACADQTRRRRQRDRRHRLQGVRRRSHHPLRLRQAAQRDHLVRVREDAARRAGSRPRRARRRSTSPSSTASAAATWSSTPTARASAA